MEEVDRILTKMRLDVDRDVRVLAGGEEQLVDTVSQDCAVVSEDEMDEQTRYLLFSNEIIYDSRTRMGRENELLQCRENELIAGCAPVLPHE